MRENYFAIYLSTENSFALTLSSQNEKSTIAMKQQKKVESFLLIKRFFTSIFIVFNLECECHFINVEESRILWDLSL